MPSTFINTLKGPETPEQEKYVDTTNRGLLSGPETDAPIDPEVAARATANKYYGTLSGPDDAIFTTPEAAALAAARTYGSGSEGFGSLPIGSGIGGIKWTGLWTEYIWDTSSPYYFMGSMTEAQLHLYLDKSIELNAVSVYGKGSGYAASTTAAHDACIQMAIDLGALYVAGMASFWPPWDANYPPPNDYVTSGLAQFQIDCRTIHEANPFVICGANLSEVVGDEVSTIAIPDYVYIDFGFPVPSSTQYFNGILMQYNIVMPSCMDHPSAPSVHINIPMPQSQMWYYFMATQMINNGAESVHFGDVFEINCYDYGNSILHKLVNMVRAYAAGANLSNTTGRPNARRGLVLCTGHTWSPNPAVQNSIYYDPERYAPLPDWQRQLLFDFHSAPLQNYVMYPGRCDSVNQPVVLDPNAPDWVYEISGGLHPLGYYCAHNACTINTDNSSSFPPVGCASFAAGTSWTNFYGWDASTWFAMQTEANRNMIIPYFFFGAKCMNPFTHYQMPGRLFTSEVIGANVKGASLSDGYYTAYTGAGNQERTMADTWGGIHGSPADWVYHNFTFENVSDTDIPPASSLIFVGDSQIYFIATDGYIHGYIRVTDGYNDGTWLTVSPSYASGILVAAKSDLVASPDAGPNSGMLLYIGTDNQIHGFNIVNVWTYTFLTWAGDPDITPDSCLIFPANDRVYYIGINNINGARQVHGFQSATTGFFTTVSPTYAAGDPDGQLQAAGGLTYVVRGYPYWDRIYYRTTEGKMAYFTVNPDVWEYDYWTFEGNATLLVDITILGNLAIYIANPYIYIYFAGFRPSDGVPRVFVVASSDTTEWGIESVSNNANVLQDSQVPASSTGQIAISPDGSTIAYVSSDNIIDMFTVGWPFIYRGASWLNTVIDTSTGVIEINSLQFTSNYDLYYCSLTGDVVHLKYEIAQCENPMGSEYP